MTDGTAPETAARTEAEQSPSVWVVVVHHGDPGPTLAAVAAVLQDPSTARRHVAVVDNSATLDAHHLPPGVAYLKRTDNPGFGAGVHLGLGLLGELYGELRADPDGGADRCAAILALNHDVLIAHGFLDAALDALADPGVGAAAGPLYSDHLGGRLWYAGGRLHVLTGTVVQSRSDADARRPRDVGFLPGAALVISPRAWSRCGGFDPSIFLYHEDLDLCLSLRRAGWRLRFAPALAAVHHVGGATGSADASPFYLEHLTATRLRPYRSRLYRCYLAAVHSLWVGVRAAGYALRRGPGDAERVRALWRGHRRALATVLSATAGRGVQSRNDP